MRRFGSLLGITLLLAACITADPLAADPLAAASPIQAEGSFTTLIDFGTLSATPVGRNCELKAALRLEFEGTLAGSAEGQLRVLVLASCPDVFASPPGTFRDVFRASLTFTGTVDGRYSTAAIAYGGVTEPGGAVKGLLRVDSETARGALKVTAQAGAGGFYSGPLTGLP